MQKWDYCCVSLGWGGGFGKKNYEVRIRYFGTMRDAEMLKSKYPVEKGKDLDAIGEALGYLGDQGWELVSTAFDTNFELGRYSAILKRPKE